MAAYSFNIDPPHAWGNPRLKVYFRNQKETTKFELSVHIYIFEIDAKQFLFRICHTE